MWDVSASISTLSFATVVIGNPSCFLPGNIRWDVKRGVLISPNYSVQGIIEVAGVRPGGRGPFLSGKGPKTIDAPPGLIGWDGRKLRQSGPTRFARTRSAGL